MTFTQGLHRAVQQYPQRKASVCDDRSQTFAELTERVGRYASGLAAHGVTREARVAILALNSDHYIETYFAIAWRGAVCVPLNFRWSEAEIAFALNDCEASVLIVDRQFAQMVDALRDHCPGLKTVIEMGSHDTAFVSAESLIAEAAPIEDVRAVSGDLFGIFYTGGTTGRSKGVLLTHGNLMMSGLSMIAAGPFGEGTIGLHVAPMFHLADMCMMICLILRGGTHVVMPMFDPGGVPGLVEENGVTDILLVPAMLQAMVDHPSLTASDISSLRTILYGASPAPEALLKRTMEKLPEVSLVQGYGMTESAALICTLSADAHRDTANPQRLRAAGRAVSDVELRILATDGSPLPQGEIGEITCRGPNVMQGYLGLEAQTADALKDGWLHTGDLGYLDDEGYVFIVDRAKDMIISGGENVYCSEVENAIASHPSVAMVAVIGIPDADMGEKVHGAIVLKPDQSLSLDQLQEHCRQHISGYKLPRSLEVLDALPISGAGKILKTELRKPFWQDQERAVS